MVNEPGHECVSPSFNCGRMSFSRPPWIRLYGCTKTSMWKPLKRPFHSLSSRPHEEHQHFVDWLNHTSTSLPYNTLTSQATTIGLMSVESPSETLQTGRVRSAHTIASSDLTSNSNAVLFSPVLTGDSAIRPLGVLTMTGIILRLT